MADRYYINALLECQPGRMPIYRVWVDNELMCERTFWLDSSKFYIDEMIYVELDAGNHAIKLELVDPSLGRVWIKRMVITNLDSTMQGLNYHVPQEPQGRIQIAEFQTK